MNVVAGIMVATLLAAGAASAESLDMAKLDQARSAVAESAALEHAAGSGRVTNAYARALRTALREDMLKLRAEAGLADVVREALSAMSRRDEPALVRLRDRLVAVERAHGRAG